MNLKSIGMGMAVLGLAVGLWAAVVGKPAPDFLAQDSKGKVHALKDLK